MTASYKDRLAGLRKYAPHDEEASTGQAETLIQKACETVSILSVLADYDIDVPPDSSGWKFYCPFGHEHSDGGMTKAARYYAESNSVYCFASHGLLTVVSLRARQWRMTYTSAAKKILEDAGISTGKVSYRKKWEDMQRRWQTMETVDHQALMEALSVALRGMDGYVARQYDEDVRSLMEKALAALGHVSTVDEGRLWLATVKDRMRQVLTDRS